MSQLILGVGHKARHGKDSFARSIEEYYATINGTGAKHIAGYHPVIVQRLAFADALRKEVNDFLSTQQGLCFLTGLPEVFVEGERLPDWVKRDPNPEFSSATPNGKHPKLLQWWGTELRRAQDENYWVNKWKSRIDPRANIVITTDMRFPNEFYAVQVLGGYTIDLRRQNQDGTPFVDPTRPADHISEIALDGFNHDFTIITKTGQEVLAKEYAITLVHFLRARAVKGGA